MAAPCRRMAGRRMLSFISCFRRTADTYNGVRQFFDTSIYRATLQTKNTMERANTPWNLMAAVCLQRLPVISADCTPIEEQFRQMMLQVSGLTELYHKTFKYSEAPIFSFVKMYLEKIIHRANLILYIT